MEKQEADYQVKCIYAIQLMSILDIDISNEDLSEEIDGIGSQLAAIDKGWA